MMTARQTLQRVESVQRNVTDVVRTHTDIGTIPTPATAARSTVLLAKKCKLYLNKIHPHGGG